MKRAASLASLRRWNESKRATVVRRQKATAAPLVEAAEFEPPKSFDEMPAITSLPVIGIAWAYLPIIGKYDPVNMHKSNMEKYEEFGKIVREDLTKSMPMVHLYDIQDIEKVYRQEGKVPHRDPLLSLKMFRESRDEWFANGGLLANNGDDWYQMRSKTQKHLLKPRAIQSYLPDLDGVALELIDKIEKIVDDKNEVEDFTKELYKWALESVGLIALETKLNCLNSDLSDNSDGSRMINAVNTIFRLWYKLEFSALRLWRYYPSKTHGRFRQNMTEFTKISMKCIQEAKARMDADRSEDREPTLLETFFYKEGMDERNAATMISDILLGGIDTTSHAIAFALYNLAKYPEEQQIAYEEVRRIAPDTGISLTKHVLDEARYVKACVKESLRLNPVIVATSRRLKDDIELSGYRIPAGVLIILENLFVSRLEENFEDANEFKPKRWIRNENADKYHPFATLPFSMGTRSCIGKRIAEQEMWTLLIRLLQRYKIEYHYEDIGIVTRLVNTPDKPLRLKFIKR